MPRLGLRVSPVVVGVSVVVVVVVVVPPPAHLRRGDGALGARHRLEHPLESVAVEAHAVLAVHVFGALRLVPSVGDVVVEEVVMVGVPEVHLADHVDLRVVHRLGVGEHVVGVVPERWPRRRRRRLRVHLEGPAGLRALGLRRLRRLGLRLGFSLYDLRADVVLGPHGRGHGLWSGCCVGCHRAGLLRLLLYPAVAHLARLTSLPLCPFSTWNRQPRHYPRRDSTGRRLITYSKHIFITNITLCRTSLCSTNVII
jgi:hypothetical protein